MLHPLGLEKSLDASSFYRKEGAILAMVLQKGMMWMELNMELLQQFVQLVKDAQISELTVRIGDWRVTIRKNVLPVSTSTQTVIARTGVSGTVIETKQGSEMSPYMPIVSGWVGIVRRQQNGKSVVQVGDTVRKGQTVCWVDSLGVRNEVRSPENGRIVEIFVEDGQPVEFGQQLMLLEATASGGS